MLMSVGGATDSAWPSKNATAFGQTAAQFALSMRRDGVDYDLEVRPARWLPQPCMRMPCSVRSSSLLRHDFPFFTVPPSAAESGFRLHGRHVDCSTSGRLGGAGIHCDSANHRGYRLRNACASSAVLRPHRFQQHCLGWPHRLLLWRGCAGRVDTARRHSSCASDRSELCPVL